MKRLLTILAITALFACNGDVEPSHEAQWSKDGKDSVVYVRYKDESGNWVNFYMQYMLFNSLFNQGGYNACYNYHRSHELPSYYQQRYSTYRPRPKSEPTSTGHHVPVNSTSTQTRSNWSSSSSSSSSRSSSSPSRSSSSSSSRSYSSPSRSSGSSYSSPSRSYSSPSRSYSSPSRSYSSPSRH